MLLRLATMAVLSALLVTSVVTAQSYGPSPPARVQPAPPAAPGTRTITVAMQGFRFVPSALTLKMGQPVVLRFANRASMEHEFVSPDFFHAARGVAVSGGEFEDGEEVHVAPGVTVSVRLTPVKTGTFRFWCAETYRGKLHRDLGMRGVITVTR